ncbi:MAG: hypothetical protein LBP87_11285 [Planctomycetaceae bacterium]|nr:hypothetical protein [Planctomycetaceae bacterium]
MSNLLDKLPPVSEISIFLVFSRQPKGSQCFAEGLSPTIGRRTRRQ